MRSVFRSAARLVAPASAMVFLLGPAASHASDLAPATLQAIGSAVDADAGRLDLLFKDLHQHPELGFMETRTAGVVAKELRAQLPVITMKGSSTPLVNDGELAARFAVPLKALLGDKNVVTALPPATGSEDVHLLLGPHTDVPFTFLIVGVADPAVFAAARREGKLVPYAAHNPNFMVDLKAIPVGTKIATTAMMELLGR